MPLPRSHFQDMLYDYEPEPEPASTASRHYQGFGITNPNMKSGNGRDAWDQPMYPRLIGGLYGEEEESSGGRQIGLSMEDGILS